MAVASKEAFDLRDEPTTFEEAIRGEEGKQWEAAAIAEIEKLEERGTWKLVQLPPGHKAIGCKWVFKRRPSSEKGAKSRYKARITAKGYMQIYGMDFRETFAPVIKSKSVRVLVAAAAAQRQRVRHYDFVSAFTNGYLKEEIYMKQIPGFVKKGQEHLVLQLIRGLYGTKQASRVWYEDLHKYLISRGFIRSKADQCIYTLYRDGKPPIIMGVYVDDLYLVCGDEKIRAEIDQHLKSAYEVTDLGWLSWSLGIRFTQDLSAGTTKMDQEAYARKVIARFGMENCHPAPTPSVVGCVLTKAMSPKTDGERKELGEMPTTYRQACGALMYLMTQTRPDIAEAVRSVCRFMSDPGRLHWTAVKRILRYLQGTSNMGITFSGSAGMELRGYCDSDYANDLDCRRSVTGYVTYLAGAPVSWGATLQRSVALSTTEAEYMALSDACKEVIWMRGLLAELGYPQGTTTVFEDNHGAIALSENDVHHKRTKHIDVRYHFTRDCVEDKTVIMEYLHTKEMIADILTKPLHKPQFQYLRAKMVA
jgi:hypothetical protein